MTAVLSLTRRQIEAMDAETRAKARAELMALDVDFQRIQRDAKRNGDSARRLLHVLNAVERAATSASRLAPMEPP